MIEQRSHKLPAQEFRIETARLWLRPMVAEDFDALLLIFTDPQVMASFNSAPFTPEQMQKWLHRNLDHQAERGYGLFSVLLKENNLLIGNCGLEIMETDDMVVAELGYDFRSDYWNQGYATEAATAVRDYAREHLHLLRLISLIRVGNQASKRVAEKIGMRFVSQYENYGRTYWQYALEANDSPQPKANDN